MVNVVKIHNYEAKTPYKRIKFSDICYFFQRTKALNFTLSKANTKSLKNEKFNFKICCNTSRINLL